MVSIARKSVRRLLGYAVRAEIDSNRSYARLASRAKNPLLREKFLVLAFEEKKHKEVLTKLFESLYQGEKIEVPDAVDEKLLPVVHLRPSSSLADILYQAMEAERSAQDFYLRLAKRVRPPKRKILEYLSKVEKSHYFMLRSEYAMAQQFEDYGERDIDKVVT
ncbi:MAG: ferritin family protein [Clostridiales bacterium]|nr:ferritin family protein [Clostridiales bacterium]